MICDTLQHLTRYKGLCKNLDTAIDYLLTHDPASLLWAAPRWMARRYSSTRWMPRSIPTFTATTPEDHKKYADLQLDITGSERAGGFTTNPGRRSAILPATAVFQDSASVVTGALGEGRFVLFFPTELRTNSALYSTAVWACARLL